MKLMQLKTGRLILKDIIIKKNETKVYLFLNFLIISCIVYDTENL